MSGEAIAPWRDGWELGPNDAPELPGDDWAIRLQTLRGGRREGVQVVELNNGPLSLHIVPTRGMGIWKGNCHGIPLGWNSPIEGPIHPSFVNLADRNGLGWLMGFDEWLCRCGLASNGPPGDDHGTFLPLHGRIANSPAHRLDVGTRSDEGTIFVRGIVEEGGLFLGRLRLTSTISTKVDSQEFVVHDRVENLSAQSAEMQLLYHWNCGPPLLEEGSRIYVPFREMAPHTPHAAKALDRWSVYGAPTPGFPEEVFDFIPVGDGGQTQVLLTNAAGSLGLVISWNLRELPRFTMWKNTGAIEDGYVTGLEPSTNYPYFKGHERKQGRVVQLPPKGVWEATQRIRILLSRQEVAEAAERISRLQGDAPGVVHGSPIWGPNGS
jgi:hypothetical protein